jgi:GT2 family glycosyltransferase
VITVVICTRNRAARLARCLEHLCDVSPAWDVKWQLVVVDNASTDDTRGVIERHASRLPIHYAFEPRPGLAHARNRGVAVAEHALLAFTDDDCLVGKNWLCATLREFARHPTLSVLGGRVMLADARDHPVSIRLHGRPEHITSAHQVMTFMSGSNMVFRREVFSQVGLFDATFGKGRHTGSAEDIDMLYRVLKHACTMRYSPRVVVMHAHGRRTDDALRTLRREYVRGRGAFYCKFLGDRQVARMAYWEVRRLLRDLLRVPRDRDAPCVLGHLAAGAFYRFVHGTAQSARRLVRGEGA